MKRLENLEKEVKAKSHLMETIKIKQSHIENIHEKAKGICNHIKIQMDKIE